ncbi:MAG: tRNA uridine-5-carboxymethylaminomethyl(34) synthesis enzyme MnmG [Fimbriimonadaceae bacterium]|nr:tRNA uridine-5-carboxymethylaminomethyl(34) synthesis enzyme MnmG [Fimbriimonadaceae bacterium]
MAFDVVVVGAGHAGIEAALASARMGRATVCITLRLDRIGHLPCNCSIGGPAKGHMAREVDALGGQMAVATDHAVTHIRRVGTSKGPAIQTVRAQVCKSDYPAFMQGVLGSEPNLTLIEGQAVWIETQGGRVSGIRVVRSGVAEEEILACRAVVLTTGTFLNGLCHQGKEQTVAAREGDQAVQGLSAFLADLGVRLRRFKTGTTPRVRLSSLNLDLTEVMPSEPEAGPLSFLHDTFFPRQELLPTWQTRTGPATHDILRENLADSPMFSGQIEGVGPRYCPSVEDKVVRFADKESHPIFLEQEEWDSESIYVQGFSTSMPAEVQLAALRTIPGLESVEVIRPGYAVEYDMADPLQLHPSLMSRLLPGLFLAGQLNGTSGYEEAAGQGIVAGINAARFVRDEEPRRFPRSESFIGVMIDDLTTKGVEDPYRMLTARAEHRLLLRHDNADLRLTPVGRELGTVSEARWIRFLKKQDQVARAREWLESHHITEPMNGILESRGLAPVKNRASLWLLLTRPGVDWRTVAEMAAEAGIDGAPLGDSALDRQAAEQLQIAAVYDGYLKRQEEEADLARRMEELRIPEGLDLGGLAGLSFESREKLGRARPATVGQASRIPGVRPTDIAILIGHLRASGRRAG